ncbi:MAG: MBL fold metallo-hydrolase [Lactobacillales bacterium]|nr:MBL fold metallo-hydrolase [Lactobacillales bacterium]
MKISILASGSSGNALYIETPKKKFLVDAGLTGKKIKELLNKIKRFPENLDAIFVTHEHSDHIKGVGILARRYNLEVYANEKTWKVLEKKLGKLNPLQKQLFPIGRIKTLGDLDIESFGVSHDAVSPQFYAFHKDGKKFAMLTDTGYVSERVCDIICQADAYLLESNHDVEMLRMGPYSWHLKQRILSDKGHLSNEESAFTATKIIGDKTSKIFLGHRSQENNLKELAHETMYSTLKERNFDVDKTLQIYDTYANQPTELFSV